MERHGLRRPFASLTTHAVGRLSPMAFLVGVSVARAARHPHPMRPATWPLRARKMSAMADPNRGRIALPPPGGGEARGEVRSLPFPRLGEEPLAVGEAV